MPYADARCDGCVDGAADAADAAFERQDAAPLCDAIRC